MSEEVEIKVAKTAGVCFGVERAINLSEKAVSELSTPIFSLGPLIHNPQVVSDFEARGLKVVDDLDQASGTMIFRSHGVTKQVQEAAKAKGLNIIDATCPLVKVPQNFAKKLADGGYFVVIVGDKDHPEIKGVCSYVHTGQYTVLKDSSEVANLTTNNPKVGIICQTTLKKSLLDSVVEECKKRFSEVKVHNTICSATRDRQEAVYELAQEVDCVVVIGGKNSSNTRKLFEISKEISGSAILIESPQEISKEQIQGFKSIGVTAGASTPQSVIEAVRSRLQELTQK